VVYILFTPLKFSRYSFVLGVEEAKVVAPEAKGLGSVGALWNLMAA